MTNLFIISGPSGAGEDSVIKGLKELLPIEKIVTSTTRPIRPGEKHGQDYYFISKEEFKEGIAKNKFFEWAEEDNRELYGGSFEEIERVKNSDKPGIWKIDYKGVINAKELIPDAISILISIPIDLVEKRLRDRKNHSEEFIKSRLDYAKGWFENADIFDYTVENKQGKLDETIEKVAKIIKKHSSIDNK